MADGAAWTLVKGDGVAVQGRCLLLGLIFWPDVDTDYVDIYDGLDSTSGRKFCRVETAVSTTRHVQFGQGVEFSSGVYVDGVDPAVQTTIIFEQLD